MRIGIDARELEGEMTGIGRYLAALIRYLSNTRHEYLLYYSRTPKTSLSSANVYPRILSGPKLLWDQVLLPRALRSDAIEVFFSPYFKKPWRLRCKSIITVNDLNPLFNEGFSWLRRFYFAKTIRCSIASADFVITLSLYVKKQLETMFGASQDKVVVNYGAVKEFFSPAGDAGVLKTTLARHGINSEYIFYVGTLMPHKNVASLIEAYNLLPEELKNKYKLVIGGGKSWDYNKLVRLAGELGLTKKVIFTGFIPDEELVFLYSGASLFVFPSFREGFGFPPLEAMACAVPVIVSNATSLPEVVGDAGILVDPHNIEDIAKAMNAILCDKDLKDALIQKGLLRVEEFSMEKMGSRILGLIESLKTDG